MNNHSLFKLAVFTALASSLGVWVETSYYVKTGRSQPIFIAQGKTITASIANYKLSRQRWIQIDLSKQRLYAWDGDRPVYAILVSTGKASTPTPTGVFAIQTRHRYARMQGYDYDVPDVPYTMYYHRGYAIHGAYWHHRFGTPVSHGCTNVAVNHARWLFNWARVGTPVVVHD
ncbi:MAG: L,D-transpeptidase [Oscillatoriales cyanobacterium C42_A2020_001]|nr:L,D-transpeptidase [Leptolyngbyaceae cyanobacterium C42_A2020_001]